VLDYRRVVLRGHAADLHREPHTRREEGLALRDDLLPELALNLLRPAAQSPNEVDRVLAGQVVRERKPQQPFVPKLTRGDS
jgi:hypothetical protein